MRVNVGRLCSIGLGLILMVISVAGTAYAGDNPSVVPEIDPAAVATAASLLGAGAVMLRVRRKK